MSTKIACFDTKPYDRELFEWVNKVYNFEIKYFKTHLTVDNVLLTQGMDVIIVFVNDVINAQMIDTLYKNGVKLIALRCSGFNNVDIKAAKNKIELVRVPSYSPNAIAEHAVALMMSLNRKIHKAYNRTREANFALSGLMGFDMYGKTAGIIGTGKIGKALIQILTGFGMKILAHDPFPDNDFAKKLGFSYTDLQKLLSTSDVISLNCPLTRETEYIINKNTIEMMKKGVMIINTGRGKLIRTPDLIQGLKNVKIGSAGLDVYEEESNLFFEDMSDIVLTDDVLARLLTFNNVIITSHQGFFTREAMQNIADTTMRNIDSWVRGEELVNRIIS
jgi:D-lactate dehydrogenase